MIPIDKCLSQSNKIEREINEPGSSVQNKNKYTFIHSAFSIATIIKLKNVLHFIFS
jgi:hypothetical protein